MLSRIGRILWKTVKWTFLVAAALFALLVLINLRDETLSDEARALLETKPIEVPDNENIFVAMAGFNAPGGDDVFEVGRRHLEKIKKESEQDPTGKRRTLDLAKEQKNKGQEEREEMRWQEVEPPFECRINKETDYWGCIHFQKERLEKTLRTNEKLVQRYHLLQELPHFVGALDPNAYFFSEGRGLVERAWASLMAQATLDLEAGNTEAGLTFFKKDMALWRRSLEGNGYLIDKMIALARMAKDVYGLSLLLSSSSISPKEQESEWRELLTPLSHEQYSLRPAMEGETRFIYNAFLEMKKWTSYQDAEELINALCQHINVKPYAGYCSVWRWWLEQNGRYFFFQPKAAFNYHVPYYKAWLKLTDLPWKDYIAQRDEVLAPLEKLSTPGIDWVYNPVGKTQTRSTLYIWDDYVGRLHDLDTYLRLIRLQLELRLANLPSEEIPAFLEQLDEAYCSPCSDFSWNAETRMLSFQPYLENEKGGITRFVSASVYVP